MSDFSVDDIPADEASAPPSRERKPGLSADQLDDKQREAVERCIDHAQRCVAITGPAGSGKTTIIQTVVEALEDAGYKVAVAAPTGKAARRIREATGLDAVTIHMLLEYTSPTDIDERTGKPYGDTYPRRTKEAPLHYDVVIGDEYAMVTHELHGNLAAAIKAGGRLLVFGDVQQLPPIETNAALAKQQTPFQRLLSKFNGIYLDKVHRQAKDSGVLDAAQRVLAGMAPRSNEDFKLINTAEKSATGGPVEKLTDLILELDEQGIDFKALNNQVIVPGNKSWVGQYKLSQLMQTLLFDEKRDMLKLSRHKWHANSPVEVGVGDKVMMGKNWYGIECRDGSRGVMNGEVGTVIAIDHDLGIVSVDFEDRIADIPPMIQVEIGNRVFVGYPTSDLHLAYALTTHKCQGSEYQNVIYILNMSHAILLNRKNFYTALTRARKRCWLLYDSKALSFSITTKEPKLFGE